MRNRLTITIATCLLLSAFQTSLGQQGSVAPPVATAEERGTRAQDGLEGPVRRVRVETAKMMVKAGKIVEGPRAIRGIATYDSMGKKIDSVDYPMESSTVPGKERYRYDDKGNIVEMVVLGTDGSILSKEAYEYEFDPLGNWTKMSTAVAVYENGKVTFEPTEVTYRTISYYYNQAIEKLGKTTAKSKPASVPATPALGTDSPGNARMPAKAIAANHPVADKVAAEVKEPVSDLAPTTSTTVAENAATDAAARKETAPEPVSPPTPSVIKLEENALRAAALELPQPDYPQAALITKASGKVEVQLLVNEKGLVTNARAQGGNPILTQAAEAAALKARFSPARISADPAMAFGVITYSFTPPDIPRPLLASNVATESKPAPEERKVAAPVDKPAAPTTSPAALTEAKLKTNPAPNSSNYEKGLTLLSARHYDEAAALFNQVVQADPNDANGYAKLAMSYSGMNKDKEALVGFKMAAQINRSALDAAAYYYWGKSNLALDKNSDAISSFKQALSMMRAEAIGLEPRKDVIPTLEHVHHYLGTAYINSKRYSDSIKEFKQVVELNPANAEAHYALAIAYIANGDRRAAAELNKKLTALDRSMAEKISYALAGAESKHGCRNIACR